MTDIAIRVDHLSKLYHIGARQEHHDTLRDVSFKVKRIDNAAKRGCNPALQTTKALHRVHRI